MNPTPSQRIAPHSFLSIIGMCFAWTGLLWKLKIAL